MKSQSVLLQPISADMVLRYCDAFGDRNPLHLDVTAARAAGFDAVIVPGNLLLIVAEAALTNVVAPNQLKGLEAQFVAPLMVDEQISMTIRGAGLANPDANVRRLVVKNGRGAIVLFGNARIPTAAQV